MILDQLNKIPIVLASQSPRRQELLTLLGLRFSVCPSLQKEQVDSSLSNEEMVRQLASQKAKSVSEKVGRETLIIGGDTIVCLDNCVLHKPKSEQEARETIRQLCNRSHEVISGICLCYHGQSVVCHDIAKVHFLPLSDEEIDYYVKNYKPQDKAGAYGIQEWIGLRAIDKIEGSFYTIMGLPTHLFFKMAEQIL